MHAKPQGGVEEDIVVFGCETDGTHQQHSGIICTCPPVHCNAFHSFVAVDRESKRSQMYMYISFRGEIVYGCEQMREDVLASPDTGGSLGGAPRTRPLLLPCSNFLGLQLQRKRNNYDHRA